MKANIIKSKLSWVATDDRETGCQYFVRGGCKATTQKCCEGCRFINPCTGAKSAYLEKIVIDQEEEIDKIVEANKIVEAKLKKLKKEVLAYEVIASTHYGEM